MQPLQPPPHPVPAPLPWRPRAPGLQAPPAASRPSPPRVTSAPPPRAPAPPPAPRSRLLCHFLIPASCFPEAGIRSRPRPVPQPLAPPVSTGGRGWGRGRRAAGGAGLQGRSRGGLWLGGLGPRSPSRPRRPTLSPSSPWPPSLSPPGLGSLEIGLLVHPGLGSEDALRLGVLSRPPPPPARPPGPAWGSLQLPAHSCRRCTFPGTQNWGLARPAPLAVLPITQPPNPRQEGACSALTGTPRGAKLAPTLAPPTSPTHIPEPGRGLG